MLHWRDVQQILLETAKPTDIEDLSWHINGAGRKVSHKYGFGKLDASAAVFAAQNWTSLPIPQLMFSRTAYPNRVIVAGDSLNEYLDVTKSDVRSSGIFTLEHVEVTVRIRHPIRGKLMISLTSPSKTVSILAPLRMNDVSTDGFESWTFSTVHSWGESALGSWHLTVNDTRSSDDSNTGWFVSWQISLRGRCPDSHTTMLDSGYRKCNVVAAKEASYAQYLSASIGGTILSASFVILCGGLYLYRRRMDSTRRKSYIALSNGETTNMGNFSVFWWLGNNNPFQTSYERVDVESPSLRTSQFFPLEALASRAICESSVSSSSSHVSSTPTTTSTTTLNSAFAISSPSSREFHPPSVDQCDSGTSMTDDSNDIGDAVRLLSPDSKVPPSLLSFIESSQHGGVGGGLMKSWSQTNLSSRFSNNSEVEREREREKVIEGESLQQQRSNSSSSSNRASSAGHNQSNSLSNSLKIVEGHTPIKLSLPPSRPSTPAMGRANRCITPAKFE